MQAAQATSICVRILVVRQVIIDIVYSILLDVDGSVYDEIDDCIDDVLRRLI